MANKPKSERATCRNCNEVIFWTRIRLPKWQEDENNAVTKANEIKKRKAGPKPERTYMSDWEASLELMELPHQPDKNVRGWYQEAWYHYREEEGSIKHCPTLRRKETREWYSDGKDHKKGDKYQVWAGPIAQPKEFCQRVTDSQYSRGFCNRAVKGNWKDEPLCGIHLAQERKDAEKYNAHREKAELHGYIVEATSDLCKILKEDFNLEAEVHFKRHWSSGGWEHTPDGRVVVDPKALLAILEETFE